MKEDPSYILSSIVILTFVITVWLQNIDDNKHYIKRNTNDDKYKFPFFWSSCLGLGYILLKIDVFNHDNKNLVNNQYTKDLPSSYTQDIYIEPFYR